MIILEEEVLPTADFLQFMAECLDAIMKDSSLIGASAWNDNGQCCVVLLLKLSILHTVALLVFCWFK